jgi:O-antigen/teichoic acid export membrane protein
MGVLEYGRAFRGGLAGTVNNLVNGQPGRIGGLGVRLSSKVPPNVSRIIRNTLAQAGTQILLVPLSFVFVMFVARRLGPEGYGLYQLAISFPTLFATAAPLGMNVYFSRDLAQRPAEAARYAGHGFAVVLFSSGVIYILMQSVAFGIAFPPETRLLIAVSGLAVVLSTITTLTSSFFRAFERMELDAYLALVEKAVFFALGLAALWIWASPLALVVVFLATAMIKLGLSQFFLNKQIGPFRLRLDKTSVSFVRIGLPFLIGSYCAVFYDNIGVTVLAKMSSPEETGTFAAGWRLVSFLNMVAIAFANATLATLARSAAKGAPAVRFVLDRVLAPLAFSTALGVSLVALLAKPIAAVVYGERFANVPTVLALLVFSVPSVFVKYFLGNTLVSLNEQPYITRVLLLAAGIGLACNLLLDSAWGALGAVASLIVAEYTVTLGLLRKLAILGTRRYPVVTGMAWLAGMLPGILLMLAPIPVLFKVALYSALVIVIIYLGRNSIKRIFKPAEPATDLAGSAQDWS